MKKDFLFITIATIIHHCSSLDCRIVEVGDKKRYLKEQCGSLFKCPLSDDLYSVEPYRDDPAWNKFSPNCTLKYNTICRNDPKFYQVCGHIRSECHANYGANNDKYMFCQTYICEHIDRTYKFSMTFKGKILSGLVNSRYADSNGENTCLNTNVDERNSPPSDEAYICKGELETLVGNDKVCDLKCDCYRCNDESFCNNQTYGIKSCNATFGEHVHAMYMCDGYKQCTGNEDEMVCNKEDIIRYCIPGDLHGPKYYNRFPTNIRPVYSHQICAVPRLGLYAYTCKDGLDQINCTDPERIAFTCNMNGYPTSLSIFALCMGFDLCDDDYHNQCIEAENGCVIHKSSLCDGNNDCQNGDDESKNFCRALSNMTCIRTISRDNQPMRFPMSWVKDGKLDCIDGVDEDETQWEKCGNGSVTRYVEKGTDCHDVFLCSTGGIEGLVISGYIELQDLCDREESCGMEDKICSSARNSPQIHNQATNFDGGGTLKLMHCLDGLENLKFQKGLCKEINFMGPHEDILGVTSLSLVGPKDKESCANSFGELYVYLSCSSSCSDSICPLKPVGPNDCTNVRVKDQILSITLDYQLTVVQKRKGHYYSPYFPCKNHKCVTYREVCDLKNDCGDNSDEENCSNNFTCVNSKEVIPKTSICDGTFDCRDYSDECGEVCSGRSKRLIPNKYLAAFSWTSGILAFLLNAFTMTTTLLSIKRYESVKTEQDKILIFLVSFGDLTTGVYLISIAVIDIWYGDGFCFARFEWLTSSYCDILGALSTFGNQLSLLSMTGLSISRALNFNKMTRSETASLKYRIIFTTMILFLITTSAFIAVIPLVPFLEDYFVNGLFYKGVNLFSATVTKETHYKVLQSYYGRFGYQKMSWSEIRLLVENMFSNDYGDVVGRKVGFYSNDAVCVFKYLVTKSDPQFGYSVAVLYLNFIFFVIITTCYCFIECTVRKNSKSIVDAAGNSCHRKSGIKLTTKVAFIIATDFLCWIPFIVVCTLHFLDVVDATNWYSLFSVVILPINSVINPILYCSPLWSRLWRLFERVGIRVARTYFRFRVSTRRRFSTRRRRTGQVTVMVAVSQQCQR